MENESEARKRKESARAKILQQSRVGVGAKGPTAERAVLQNVCETRAGAPICRDGRSHQAASAPLGAAIRSSESSKSLPQVSQQEAGDGEESL